MVTARARVGETPQRLLDRVSQSWAVTYPLIVASLSTVAVAFVDTVVVGRYGTEALATIALALPVYVFASALVIPWGTAVQVLVARWSGSGQSERIGRLLVSGLLVCGAIGLAMAVVLVLGAGVLTRLIAGGQDLPDADLVLRILALGLPFVAITTHYRGMFGGLKQTKVAMRVAVLVAVANIPLDILLVFGLDLAAVGSALGTWLATVCGAAYLSVEARRHLRPRYPVPSSLRVAATPDVVGPLWRIGWPDASFGLFAYGADLAMVAIVASLGAASLAAHRTLLTTVLVLWVVVFSCSSATSILAGQRLGAGDIAGVAAWRRAGTVLVVLLSVPLVLPAVLAPRPYFSLFTTDADVIEQASQVAPLLLVLLAGMVVAMPFTGVLRAGGDTRGIMWIGLASQVLVALTVVWLLGQVLGLGLLGVMIGLVAGWTTRAILTLLRHATGIWQRDLST